MLPVMRRIAEDVFVFQQDSAPAHRARETVQFLQQQIPGFISPDLWPPNSPDLNPVDYRIWGLMQERVYKTAVPDVSQLNCISSTLGQVCLRMSSTTQSTSGECNYKRV